MFHQSSELLVQHRGTERWKEWIPLATQQLRLRSLIQVIAYNVNTADNESTWRKSDKLNWNFGSDSQVKHAKYNKTKKSFYYTLHLTTMSAPFYTSEKLENENPKWAEIEIKDLINHVNVAVNGIVIRLWMHREGDQDEIITVWGIYFTGLCYLGPKLCVEPSSFHSNTIVFHMHGGYFTAPHCFKDIPKNTRFASVKLKSVEVRASYGVNLLLRLHTIQQVTKQQSIASQSLRDKISLGRFNNINSRESAALRKLLNRTQPKAPQRQEILKLKRELELVKFRVTMLNQEKLRKQKSVSEIQRKQDVLIEKNQERGSDLMSKYQTLHKLTSFLQEWKKNYIDLRESFLHCNAQLTFRRKQLISELSYIYPVNEISNNVFTICGVHLPDSENFYGHDEVAVSVALGFAAHVVQMISVLLHIPLRYPLIHFGSRSKIIDHIAEKLPDKDREFPLFSRGKDKLQFNYGVYLLNKNIAQLRCYCGIPTQDLRATLPNLSSLLHLRGGHGIDIQQRNFSGSSFDLQSSSQNISPVGSLQSESAKRQSSFDPPPQFKKGHKISKSMGSTDFQYHISMIDRDMNSESDVPSPRSKGKIFINGSVPSNSHSYSLDKGLDEYNEVKKVNKTFKPTNMLTVHHRAVGEVGHIASEPNLTPSINVKCVESKTEKEYASSGDEGQKRFLQTWQACGPAPICSDDDETFRHPFITNHSVLCSDSGVECDQLGSPRQLCHLQHDNFVNKKQYDKFRPSSCTDDSFYSTSHNANLCINVLSGTAPSEKNLSEQHIVSADGPCFSKNDSNCINSKSTDSVSTEYYRPVSPPDRSSDAGVRESKSMQFPLDQVESANHSAELERCLEELNDSLDSSVLIDNLFANVTSRTEALASNTSSFNLMRSRHNSVMDGSL